MLAKQGWRILTNPNLLLSKILKARYFPKVDFMQAKKGYNSSYTWRSILEGRQVIEEGIKWRLGDGNSVRVWGDKWIPRPYTFQPITPASVFNPELRVAELIDKDSRSWNSDVLTTNELGVIWKAKVPNKIKIFLWRACKEAIPTTQNLIRRKCDVEPACMTCGHPSKDAKHVFYDCSFARQIWALANIPSAAWNQWPGSLEDWFLLIRQSLDHAEFNMFVVVCWWMWKRRNALVMENKNSTPLEILGWHTATILGVTDPEHGEVIAARTAVEFANQMGWRSCVIEGDCLQVIQNVNAVKKDSSPIGSIISDIHILSTTFDSVVYMSSAMQIERLTV
ncbi:UNVERIFIED_CONTAM: putative ribonuclease H protein [Sesamum radiatum]|uniref:Ribonuclease H protein n=1 Tax=Sesamum radiatum TaxID=300843 RepID=A0AAW2TUU1_SESRA